MISFKGIQFPKDVISLEFEESTNRVGTPSGTSLPIEVDDF
jgi:hypothetical protein